MSEQVEGQALCGKCRVPLEGPEDPTDDSVFSCPECGRRATKAEVMAEMHQYLEDSVARMIDGKLSGLTNSSTGKGLGMTYDGFNRPDREYLFVPSVEIVS